MKKFLFAAALTFTLAVFAQVEASDYFAGTTRSGWQVYLKTETVKPHPTAGYGGYCWVKMISPRNVVKQLRYGFGPAPSGEGYHFSAEGDGLWEAEAVSGTIYYDNHNGYPVTWNVFRAVYQILGGF